MLSPTSSDASSGSESIRRRPNIPPPPRVPYSAVAETHGSSAVAEGGDMLSPTSNDASSDIASIEAEGDNCAYAMEQEILRISAARQSAIAQEMATLKKESEQVLEVEKRAKKSMEQRQKVALDLQENERRMAELQKDFKEKKALQRALCWQSFCWRRASFWEASAASSRESFCWRPASGLPSGQGVQIEATADGARRQHGDGERPRKVAEERTNHGDGDQRPQSALSSGWAIRERPRSAVGRSRKRKQPQEESSRRRNAHAKSRSPTKEHALETVPYGRRPQEVRSRLRVHEGSQRPRSSMESRGRRERRRSRDRSRPRSARRSKDRSRDRRRRSRGMPEVLPEGIGPRVLQPQKKSMPKCKPKLVPKFKSMPKMKPKRRTRSRRSGTRRPCSPANAATSMIVHAGSSREDNDEPEECSRDCGWPNEGSVVAERDQDCGSFLVGYVRVEDGAC